MRSMTGYSKLSYQDDKYALNMELKSVNNKNLNLKIIDYKILEYFIKNPNQILSREQILLKVWGFDYKGQERSVDTHIKILRKALGPYQKGIKTVIKQGYCFETKVFENG